MSAFFSKLRLQAVFDDSAQNRQRIIFLGSPIGGYTSIINPSSPGPRPSRESANEQPYYWLTGGRAQTGDWRNDFATLMTSDRQFAKAAVNYLWAYFFGAGIVDPPDGWDLARTDPSVPAPDGWATQNSHPEVLDALADYFIRNNDSIKSVVRLIVNSNTYQLSSRYPDGKWQDAYKRYFARYEARRMTAEQLLDSVAAATGTESQLSVPGLPNVLRYANQLPYPNASTDGGTEGILTSLGRGDYISRAGNSRASLFGVLDLMNNYTIANRTRGYLDRFSAQTQIGRAHV